MKSYYAIAIEIGTKDTLIASNRQLHEAMTRLTIAHSYEGYDGDHTNRVGERIERNALPFFEEPRVAGECDVSIGPALITGPTGCILASTWRPG